MQQKHAGLRPPGRPPAPSAPEGFGTVLVIDDSDIARTAICDLLSDAGFRVVELASPIGATRAIMSHQVSVVVVDVLMPAMRGDRLAQLFRDNPRFRGLAVVLVSGESEVGLEELLVETGADAAVSKSNLRELVPTIIRAWRRRKALGG